MFRRVPLSVSIVVFSSFIFTGSSFGKTSQAKGHLPSMTESISGKIPGGKSLLKVDYPSSWKRKVLFGAMNLFPGASSQEAKMPYVLINIDLDGSPATQSIEDELALQKQIYSSQIKVVKNFKLPSGEQATKLVMQLSNSPQFYIGNDIAKSVEQGAGQATQIFFFKNGARVTIRATLSKAAEQSHGESVNSILNSVRTETEK